MDRYGDSYGGFWWEVAYAKIRAFRIMIYRVSLELFFILD